MQIQNLLKSTANFITVSKNGKYRAFPVTNSMPPHKESSFVVGEYLERTSDIVDGKTYIVITKNSGMSYKIVQKNLALWLIQIINL
jgi:hypothetical protein